MMKKYKVSGVSYLNSIPMIHGLTQSQQVIKNTELSLDTPNICAEKLMTHKADIGLVLLLRY